jgi:hypothetical protein
MAPQNILPRARLQPASPSIRTQSVMSSLMRVLNNSREAEPSTSIVFEEVEVGP